MMQHALSTLLPARDKLIALFIFIREWLRSPRSIGMVCPSGPFLARNLASCVPLCAGDNPDGTYDLVVELGAGTGTVTQELLRHGIHPHHLLVLERAEGMVDLLRLRFPGLRIVHGDASDLSRYIPSQARVACIVSSLPLVSLPDETRRAIIEEMRRVLGDGLLVQYTYSWGRHFILLEEGFRCERSRRVWRNLPPARVLCLRTGEKAGSSPSRACLCPTRLS